MSELVEGRMYRESELALEVEAVGWMRSDLALAGAAGLVSVCYRDADPDSQDSEPLVVVSPGKAKAFADFLTERAAFWNAYLARQRALTDLIVKGNK
jgi:hypothetical protein